MFINQQTLVTDFQIVYCSPNYHLFALDSCNALKKGFPLTIFVLDHTLPHSWHHEYGLGFSSTLCIAAARASLSFVAMFQLIRCIASTVACHHRRLVGFSSYTLWTAFYRHGGYVEFVGCSKAWPGGKEIGIQRRRSSICIAYSDCCCLCRFNMVDCDCEYRPLTLFPLFTSLLTQFILVLPRRCFVSSVLDAFWSGYYRLSVSHCYWIRWASDAYRRAIRTCIVSRI